MLNSPKQKMDKVGIPPGASPRKEGLRFDNNTSPRQQIQDSFGDQPKLMRPALNQGQLKQIRQFLPIGLTHSKGVQSILVKDRMYPPWSPQIEKLDQQLKTRAKIRNGTYQQQPTGHLVPPMTIEEIKDYLSWGEKDDDDRKPFESLKKVLRRRYKVIKNPNCGGHKRRNKHSQSGLRSLKTMFSAKNAYQNSPQEKQNPDQNHECNVLNCPEDNSIITEQVDSQDGSKKKKWIKQNQIHVVNEEEEYANSHNEDDGHGSCGHSDLEYMNDSMMREQREIEELERLKSKYCKRSLNQFEIDDTFRRWAIRLVEWPWFDRVIILLIACNSIMLGAIDYTWKDDGKQTNIPFSNMLADELEIFFTLFFTFEACVKILSSGLIFDNGCYLRDAWNWLDFTVVVTALLQNIPGISNVSALRTFRLFRPLRSLSAVPSMKLLVNTLLHSVGQLSNILILDQFFIFTFSIFGLQMWEGVMNYRCRQTKYPKDGDWKVIENDDRICGSFHQCAVTCGSLYELNLPDDNGVMTQYYLDDSIPLNRDSMSAKFNYGITNFDAIGQSYLTIFQCTTLEGWSNIMMMIQDGYNMYTAAVFFIIQVLLCNYFLLNLTVAVMLDKFKQLNQRSTDKMLQKYERNHERVQNLKKINYILELRKGVSWQNKIKMLFEKAVYTNPGQPPRKGKENKRYEYWICRACWIIIKIPAFHAIIMVMIVLNTIILATDSYPSPDYDIISSTNQLFNALFLIECIIKLTGLKFSEWKEDKFNVFDLGIVIASISEMMLGEESASVISALRAFRLIRLIRLARSNPTLRSLLDSIALTVRAIANFMVILAIFIYVFSLLGMEIFAGKFKFDKDGMFDADGEVPRQNFDSITWAIITVFQVLVGDQWNEVMYKAYLAVSPGAVIYFLVLVLVGKIVMLNLFLSIILGNFEQASLLIRGQIEDKVLKEFERSQEEFEKMYPDFDNQVAQDASPAEPNRARTQGQANAMIEINKVSFERESPGTDKAFNRNRDFRLNVEPIQTAEPMLVHGIGNSLNVSPDIIKPQLRNSQQLNQQSLDLMTPATLESGKIPRNVKIALQKPEPKSSKDPSFDSSIDLQNNQPGQIGGNFYNYQQHQQDKPESFVSIQGQNLQFKKSNTYKEDKNSKTIDFKNLSPEYGPLDDINNNDMDNGSSQIKRIQQDLRRLDQIQSEEDVQSKYYKKGQNNIDDQQQIQSPLDSDRENMDTNRNLLKAMPLENQPMQHFQMDFGPNRGGENVDPKMQDRENFKQKLSIQTKEFNNSPKNDKDKRADGRHMENSGEASDTENSKCCTNPVYQFMSESSLFIFHRESAIRQFMLRLTTSSIVKRVTQKDRLLSQIQNGGEYDEESEEDFEAQYHDPSSPQQNQQPYNGDGSMPASPSKSLAQTPLRPRNMVDQNRDHGGRQSRKVVPNNVDDSALRMNPALAKLSHLQNISPEQLELQIAKLENNRIMSDQQFREELTSKVASKLQCAGLVKVNDQEYQNFQKAQSQKRNQKKAQSCTAYIMKKTNQFNRYSKRKCICCKWTLNQWFEYIIYFMILLSMIMLIIDNPMLDPKSDISLVLSSIDYVITICFTIEAICRIMALGFIYGSVPQRKAYILSGSNQIDFIVCIGCDFMIWYHQNLSQMYSLNLNQQTIRSFKVLRSLRALRPLRMISKNQGLRLAVGSLFGAMPAIANGMIVCFLFVLIYAIIGVSMFKGTFYHCVNTDTTDAGKTAAELWLPNIETKADCVSQAAGAWVNNPRNFDSFMNSIEVLFETITTEGWMDLMYQGIDSYKIGYQPVKNCNLMKSLYFISFIIVGNIFIMNIFVGVVIDKFNRLKDRMCGYALMTRDQKEWVEQEKQMIRLDLQREKYLPNNLFQKIAYFMQNHKYFEFFITFCIFFSVILMAMRYYQMPPEYERNLEVFGNLLTIIYNVEAVIKIIALEKDYFQNNWNRFDFFIVVAADISIVFELFVSSDNDSSSVITVLTIIKAIRIMRVFRLIRTNKNLSVLVNSLIVILPSIANVGSLILLMLFIFAVIGMNMFSGIHYQKELNQNNNFTSFGMSLVLLIRCATGENWNILMRELALQSDKGSSDKFARECLVIQSYEDMVQNGPKECGTSQSFMYFALFIVVIQMMMLNLFIAVVLEGFSSTNKEHTGVVTSQHFQELLNVWETYDPQATGFIEVKDLIFLIYELKEPLGRKNEFEHIKGQFCDEEERNKTRACASIIDKTKRFVVNSDKEMIVDFRRSLNLLKDLKLPVYTDFNVIFKCHFKDVVKKITMLALEKRNPSYNQDGIEPKHERILKRGWTEKYSDLKTQDLLKDINNEDYTTGRLWAALFIRSCMKSVGEYRSIQRQKVTFKRGSRAKRAQSPNKSPQQQDVEPDDSPAVSLGKLKSKKGSYNQKAGVPGVHVKVESETTTALNHILKVRNYMQTEKQMRKKSQDDQEDNYGSQNKNEKNYPQILKDTERSTWWSAEQNTNYKMRRWINNEEIRKPHGMDYGPVQGIKKGEELLGPTYLKSKGGSALQPKNMLDKIIEEEKVDDLGAPIDDLEKGGASQ